MWQLWVRASRSRLFLIVAATSALALAVSSPIYSAVNKAHILGSTSGSLVVARPVEVVAAPSRSTAGEASRRTYRLRWPSRPGQRATYNLTLNSVRPRAISLRVYGIRVPRGFGISFLVACEHRGPAAVSWDWKQRGSAVRITVNMTTGKCYRPGPQVAGTSAALTFRFTP